MRRHLRYRPSPALIISIVALFVALGGTGYALTVTGKTVKNNSLTGADVKNNSLTTKDIKDRSLRARDFLGGELPGGGGGGSAPGKPGSNGSNGSALGYARVNGNGTIDPTASKNVALISKFATGHYCLNYTGGTASNFVATIDVSGADSRKSRVSGTAVPAAVGPSCPAGADIVIFTAQDRSPDGTAAQTAVPTDLPFYIAVVG
jgi:hypothetical protein